MQVHKGSCHCGTVTFEVTGQIDEVTICNCSVCTKKGIIHCPVQDEHFHLLTGEESLSLYRFGSEKASHWFCSKCGIHTFGRPRMDPSRYTVNARCLDDFEQVLADSAEKTFNGKDHPLDEELPGSEYAH